MSDFIPDTPDRPLNWTLASESQIKKLPNREELWDMWRKQHAEAEQWKESVGYYRKGMGSSYGSPLPVNRINTYFEMQEEPGL